MGNFKTKGLTLIVLIVFSMLWQACKTEKTELSLCERYMVSTKTNSRYSHKDIFLDYVELVDYEIVGVEIGCEVMLKYQNDNSKIYKLNLSLN
jgi:hypothetical protein